MIDWNVGDLDITSKVTRPFVENSCIHDNSRIINAEDQQTDCISHTKYVSISLYTYNKVQSVFFALYLMYRWLGWWVLVQVTGQCNCLVTCNMINFDDLPQKSMLFVTTILLKHTITVTVTWYLLAYTV